MFFVISKLLKSFLFPLTWILGLLIVAYFVKNRRWRRGLFWAAIVLLLLFTNKPLLNRAQYATTKAFAETTDPQEHYKVAVVMGGFGHINTQTHQLCYYKDRGARIWEPVRLLQEGVVEKILVSGDQTIQLERDGSSTADAFVAYMRQVGVPDSCWLLEQHARNTEENARYSVAMLDSLGYTASDCLLVTSASHMQRATDCFANQGWTLDSYAVNIYRKPGKPNFKDFLPAWEYLTDWQEIINEWFGNIVYRIVF